MTFTKSKKILTTFLVMFLVVGIVSPLAVKANEQQSISRNIVINKNEIVPYNFVVVARETIDFQGEAQRDIIAASGTINISGPVHGDVIIAGGEVEISGPVDGNVRVLGGSVKIKNKIGKNLTIAGGSVNLEAGSEVGWDVMAATGALITKGKINGNINAVASNLTLGGEIGGNANLYISKKGQLELLSSAKINGDINYWAPTKAAINSSAIINGKTNYYSTFADVMKSKNRSTVFSLFKLIIAIFSSLVIGMILINLFKEQITKVNDRVKQHPWKMFGWGLVFLVLIPVASLLLLVFIITIPVALILIGLYCLAIYLAKIFVAILLGQWLIKAYAKYSTKNSNITDQPTNVETESLFWPMIIGIAVYTLILRIPFIGGLVSFIAGAFILGALFKLISEWIESRLSKTN